MEFLPTWTDYSLLVVFASLFLLSGWLTYLVLCHEKKWLERPPIGSERVDAASNRLNLTGKEITTDERFSFLEVLLIILISALVVTSIILLLTVQLGIFRIRFWLLLLFLFNVLVVIYLRLVRSPRVGPSISVRYKFEKSELLALPICLLAAFMFHKPAESINTRDPGAYVNIALKLSEAGSLKFNDPDFQQFDSPERQKLFLQAPLDKNPYPQVLAGFHLIDPASGELVPRYFHLFPLWLTVFFKLWRFSGMFAANTLFGVLSVLILVPLGQRLFGSRLVGLSSAGLLATNMGQIWIVRSPFSEILAQVFLLAGIWILSIGMIENRKRYCILAGFLFGLTLFVRVDSLLILAALLIFAWLSFMVQLVPPQTVSSAPFVVPLVETPQGTRSLRFPLVPFLITLSLAVAYASLHTAMFALPYFSNVTDVLASSLFIPSSLTLAAGFCFFLILSFKVRARLVGFFSSETIRTRTFFGLCLIVTGLFVYAYFIRPHLQPRNDYIPLPFPQTGSVRFYDEINLVRLGWYLSPLGLLLVYLGSLILLRRAVKERVLALRPFLLVLGFFSLFYLYKSRAFPENYWVIRRYVEIVIPGFLMLASLTVVSFFDVGKWIDLAKWVPDIHKGRPTPSPSREGNQYNSSPEGTLRGHRFFVRSTAWLPILRVVSVIAFLFLAGWQLRASYPLLNQTEWEKTFSQLAGLAGANRDADVLLLERGQFQDFFSSPLKFIFHKTVYAFANNQPEVQAFDSLMDEWTQQGKRVNLLASEEHTELHSRKYRFVPRERFRFHTKVVEQTYERIPQSMEDLRFTVQIYKVERKLQQDDSGPIAINVGYNFGFMTTGFYATELSSDYEPCRWSGAQSAIELPPIEASQDAILLLRLRQDFPKGITPGPVRIFFNESLIDESKLSPQFEVIKCAVPRSLLNLKGKNEIAFSSNTFCPARLGSSDDIRELGFMLHYLKLQSLAPITAHHPYFLDFGAQSDLVDGQLTGFYGREPGSYRWTEPKAQVILPMQLAAEPDLKISLRAVKSCPHPNFKQFLTLSVNDVDIGKTELFGTWDEFKVYQFLIPKRARGFPNTAIKIRVVPPWIPKRTDYYTDDWRALGCGIDWMKIGAKGE